MIHYEVPTPVFEIRANYIKDNPGQTKDFAKLFNDSFTLKTNSILGILSDPIENEYDLILTNPPYVMSSSGNLKDEIKKDGELVNYYKINAMGIEGTTRQPRTVSG